MAVSRRASRSQANPGCAATQKKTQIGDHALPKRCSGLSTHLPVGGKITLTHTVNERTARTNRVLRRRARHRNEGQDRRVRRDSQAGGNHSREARRGATADTGRNAKSKHRHEPGASRNRPTTDHRIRPKGHDGSHKKRNRAGNRDRRVQRTRGKGMPNKPSRRRVSGSSTQ